MNNALRGTNHFVKKKKKLVVLQKIYVHVKHQNISKVSLKKTNLVVLQKVDVYEKQKIKKVKNFR